MRNLEKISTLLTVVRKFCFADKHGRLCGMTKAELGQGGGEKKAREFCKNRPTMSAGTFLCIAESLQNKKLWRIHKAFVPFLKHFFLHH